jgi:hypothetical protein
MSELVALIDAGYHAIWREDRLEGLRPRRMVLYFDLDEGRRAAGLDP